MTENILPSIELETAPGADASVIWLHGLGADGNDFVPIVPELGLSPSKPVRFIFPHAPVRPVTINNGFRMRAWYDIAAADLTNRADLAGVRESQAYVREARNINAFRATASRYLDARLRTQVLQALYFPFILFLAMVAELLLVPRAESTTLLLLTVLSFVDVFAGISIRPAPEKTLVLEHRDRAPA